MNKIAFSLSLFVAMVLSITCVSAEGNEDLVSSDNPAIIFIRADDQGRGDVKAVNKD